MEKPRGHIDAGSGDQFWLSAFQKMSSVGVNVESTGNLIDRPRKTEGMTDFVTVGPGLCKGETLIVVLRAPRNYLRDFGK